MVGGSAISGESLQRRSIYEKDIGPAIVIVIKDSHTRAGALEDVCAGIIAAKNVGRSQSCLLSRVPEFGDLCRGALGRGGCSSPQRSRNDLPNYEQNPADAGVHRCTPSCFAVTATSRNTLDSQACVDNLSVASRIREGTTDRIGFLVGKASFRLGLAQHTNGKNFV
jgi:hypothetical protein